MMDEATKAIHLRAAVALSSHPTKLSKLEERAWSKAARLLRQHNPNPAEWNAIDIEAARLLRECVAKGEPLR